MATNVERPLEWMRFDPVKFAHLVDEMPRAQIGTVMKLILRLWEFGPMTEAAVRTVANGDFECIRGRMFEVDGLLSFEMIEGARTYGKRAQSQRVEAGKASAAKRNEQSTTVQRTFNDRSTDVLSMSISSSTQKKERATAKPPDGFDPFWAAYPIHKAKADAVKAWGRLSDAERNLCLPAITAQVKAHHFRGKDGQDFIPYGASWLNARRWEDEISSAAAKQEPMAWKEAEDEMNAIRAKSGRRIVEPHEMSERLRKYNGF